LIWVASHGITSVSAAYNFTQSGAGDYSIEPSNLFTYIDSNGTVNDIYATVQDVAKFKLSGNLAVSRVLDKRVSYVSCTSTERTILHNAAASAQTYASKAYSYVKSISSGTRRYRTWFGIYTTARHTTVQGHFRLISSREFSSFTYDCTCSRSDWYAYVCAYIVQLWYDRSVAD